MKATKRSLIVSIAILCVCALSLTSASFAWFTASKTAMVDTLDFNVKAQSDIKLSAKSAAYNDTNSEFWVSIVEPAHFTDDGNTLETFVADMTVDTTVGDFKVPKDREKVDAKTGTYADANGFDDAEDGSWLDFTVYVRTNENKAVNFTFSGFGIDTNKYGTKNVAEALSIGIDGTDEVIMGTAKTNSFTIPASAFTAFDSADANTAYRASVTFHVWVEGTHGACIDANAVSLKNYTFSMDAQYAE